MHSLSKKFTKFYVFNFIYFFWGGGGGGGGGGEWRGGRLHPDHSFLAKNNNFGPASLCWSCDAGPVVTSVMEDVKFFIGIDPVNADVKGMCVCVGGGGGGGGG